MTMEMFLTRLRSWANEVWDDIKCERVRSTCTHNARCAPRNCRGHALSLIAHVVVVVFVVAILHSSVFWGILFTFWRRKALKKNRWSTWNHDRNEVLRVALFPKPVFSEMWFLTINPFIRIPVFIAKLSERQYCWRVIEDLHSQEYI